MKLTIGPSPWQDHKTKSIEYSHATCLWIVQIHCVYVHVMGIFALFLFFSQVDFAIIRLMADLLVTGYSTVWFIQVLKKLCIVVATQSAYVKNVVHCRESGFYHYRNSTSMEPRMDCWTRHPS